MTQLGQCSSQNSLTTLEEKILNVSIMNTYPGSLVTHNVLVFLFLILSANMNHSFWEVVGKCMSNRNETITPNPHSLIPCFMMGPMRRSHCSGKQLGIIQETPQKQYEGHNTPLGCFTDHRTVAAYSSMY